MSTQLTVPITASLTHATIDGWELSIKRNPDLTVNNSLSSFAAEISFRNGGGVVNRVQRFVRTGPELPAAVRNAIANLQSVLITYARNQGVLPNGTDTSDFP
jgi:hypothetical protein